MSAQSNKPQFYDEYDLKVVDPNWLQQRVKPKRHIGLEADLCILCRACEDVCPWDCIYMLSGEIVADADTAAIKDQSGNAAAVFVICRSCSAATSRTPAIAAAAAPP